VAALTGPRRPSIALPRDAAEGRFWGANAGARAAEIARARLSCAAN